MRRSSTLSIVPLLLLALATGCPAGAPVVVGGTRGTLVPAAIDATRIEVPFGEAPVDEEPGTQTFVMKLTP